jgi:hypothetical protein
MGFTHFITFCIIIINNNNNNNNSVILMTEEREHMIAIFKYLAMLIILIMKLGLEFLTFFFIESGNFFASLSGECILIGVLDCK